jgi:pimeloyl-ACP methyl ester carboxylesterase
MPGAGTHITIIQRLAEAAQNDSDLDLKRFLTNPNLNADWTDYASPDALQGRYAVLGAMGPDMFYLMLDYGGGVQQFEDVAIKIAGTFRCVGQLTGDINNLVESTLDTFTDGVWKSIEQTFGYLKGILVDGLLDLLIDKNNFWFFFLPLREVDDYRHNWYWADTLHYVKSGCFTQKLLDNCKALQAATPDTETVKCLSAYSLGYLSHYVADTIGHAYVNRIVESPWRNHWQRHHLVENFIDAYVWASWHDIGSDPSGISTDEKTLDSVRSMRGDVNRDGAARLNYARLNDLSNIGTSGIDPIVDSAINSVCNLIQQGLFDIGVSSLPPPPAIEDPIFTTWTQFIHDAMWETYSSTPDAPSRMGRFPSVDDIAGAYGAYRIVLSLATEEDVEPPQMPNILGDLQSILNQMISSINAAIGSVGPPPSVGGSGFSLDALWDAVKAYVKWLGQVADAALKVIGDIISAAIQAGVTVAADTIKAGLYLLNSLLYSIYHPLRMTLVMSAFSVPFNEDLMAMWGPLDLQTLWNAPKGGDQPLYPIVPVVSERDFAADSSHTFSPYRPYFLPSNLAPVNVEFPSTNFPQQILNWTSPDDMLDSSVAGTDNMFSAAGPAPATTVPLINPADGSKLTDLETFDGSQRYFGSIMANCDTAIRFAVSNILGTPYPKGTTLPDYNLDCDRGFAWPCWDVDFPTAQGESFPWNGADPYPADTVVRVNTPITTVIPLPQIPMLIDWGDQVPKAADPGNRPFLTRNDPFGRQRSGDAWVNAETMNPAGNCNYAEFQFPSIIINPNSSTLKALDQCMPAKPNPNPPSNGLLTFDYQFAETQFPHFLHSDPTASPPVIDDLVQIFEKLPYTGDKTPENDGRLADFLRALASTGDPKLILANAVSLKLNNGISRLLWDSQTLVDTSPIPVDDKLVTAVAQLGVTGRTSYENFVRWVPGGNGPQDTDLVQAVKGLFPNAKFDPAALQAAAHSVLDTAYTTLWAIRSNDPGWRAFRSSLGWIAVSGFDDTPHRPVNVPTAPYPQYDIDLDVPYTDPSKAGTFSVTTRYMVASAHTFVGPIDPEKSSFIDPLPNLLQAPIEPFSSTPAPRTIPKDLAIIPAGNKIIIYIHGGGSRAEEAVNMANWLIAEGHAAGEEYTVISFDLPNSAYGTSFDVGRVVGSYNHQNLYILGFDQSFIIQFIETLDLQLGNVKGRIAAVMGGSLGGNMSALMTDHYDQNHGYLNTIVAWSVTATSPSKYLGIVKVGDVAAYIAGQEGQVTLQEIPHDHAEEVKYISNMYASPLSADPLLYIPPQPIMWYRGGYAPDGSIGGWQPCKDRSIAGSRYDRYEVYSPNERRWTTAIDLEQISFSFQDNGSGLSVVTAAPPGMPNPHLLLVAGEQDNFFPNEIHDSTIDVARQIRLSGHGKAEFWLDTGHSIHAERPQLFAREIVYFLTHLDAGDSPNGVVVTTVPQAADSVNSL